MNQIPYGLQSCGSLKLFICKLNESLIKDCVHFDIYDALNKQPFYSEFYEIQKINGKDYLIIEIEENRHTITKEVIENILFKNNSFEYQQEIDNLIINRTIYLNFISKDISNEEEDYYTLMSDYCFSIKETEYEPSQYIGELLDKCNLEYLMENYYVYEGNKTIEELMNQLNQNQYGYIFKHSEACQKFIEGFYK